MNALDDEQLRKAASLTKGDLIIAQEGLFIYMPRQDQKEVAQNVLGILKDRGGVWITDVSLKSELRLHLYPKRDAMVGTLQKEINVSLHDNAFADDAAVKSFFESEGFSIEDKINLFEMKDSLVSPARTSADLELSKSRLETRYIYLLRPTKA